VELLKKASRCNLDAILHLINNLDCFPEKIRKKCIRVKIGFKPAYAKLLPSFFALHIPQVKLLISFALQMGN